MSNAERANDLEEAWSNFDPDEPLEIQDSQHPHPFYITPPTNVTGRIERDLLRTGDQFILSGHRGCGKTTELRRLAVSPKILDKYLPITFSIFEVADNNDVDYKDVLLAIASRLFASYKTLTSNGNSGHELQKLIDRWRGSAEYVVTEVEKGREKELELKFGAGIKSLFGTPADVFGDLGGKLKFEPAVRKQVRMVFESHLSELIDAINLMAKALRDAHGKSPLVLVDDLDKLSLAHSQNIFTEHQVQMMAPACAIVYTVASALYYDERITRFSNRYFLPCVKLHEKGSKRSIKIEGNATQIKGYGLMRQFVHVRMNEHLITTNAINTAICNSGGLYRELCRILRIAIDYALDSGRARIELPDVTQAVREIGGDYHRWITAEDIKILKTVRETNEYYRENVKRMAELLQALAAFEYVNGESPWCDAHPALDELLDRPSP